MNQTSIQLQGGLRKMPASLDREGRVNYQLQLDEQGESLNQWVGHKLKMSYLQSILCIACGRKTNKSFQQGHCFPCMRSLAACDICIVKPELCHYHEGTCREPEWGEKHCFQPHIIYLANTSGLKVGITRQTQVPTRWIDQGATQALAIARVKTRLQSGLIENALKTHVKDKTDWRAMLKGQSEEIDLPTARETLFQSSQIKSLVTEITDFSPGALEWLTGPDTISIVYPVQAYPSKVSSINLEKTPEWEGRLLGIKGQYLITSVGVINLRKYSGYQVEMELSVS